MSRSRIAKGLAAGAIALMTSGCNFSLDSLISDIFGGGEAKPETRADLPPPPDPAPVVAAKPSEYCYREARYLRLNAADCQRVGGIMVSNGPPTEDSLIPKAAPAVAVQSVPLEGGVGDQSAAVPTGDEGRGGAVSQRRSIQDWGQRSEGATGPDAKAGDSAALPPLARAPISAEEKALSRQETAAATVPTRTGASPSRPALLAARPPSEAPRQGRGGASDPMSWSASLWQGDAPQATEEAHSDAASAGRSSSLGGDAQAERGQETARLSQNPAMRFRIRQDSANGQTTSAPSFEVDDRGEGTPAASASANGAPLPVLARREPNSPAAATERTGRARPTVTFNMGSPEDSQASASATGTGASRRAAVEPLDRAPAPPFLDQRPTRGGASASEPRPQGGNRLGRLSAPDAGAGAGASPPHSPPPEAAPAPVASAADITAFEESLAKEGEDEVGDPLSVPVLRGLRASEFNNLRSRSPLRPRLLRSFSPDY